MSNVELIRDRSGRNIWFRTTCECMSDDHPLSVEIDFDHEFPEMSLFFKCVTGDYRAYQENIAREEYDTWREHFINFKNHCRRIWWRIKNATKLLSGGYLELEEAFLFRGKDHIEEFANTILEGSKKLEVSAPEVKRLHGIIKELQAQVKAKQDG